jgi:signal transduction histidine kinase
VQPIQETLLALSSEVALVCDSAGRVRWADARAERLLGAQADMLFAGLAVPGSEDKARRFLQAAAAGETETWELALLVDGRPVIVAWRGAPAPGGAVLVGNLVPQHYAALQDHVSAVLGDFTLVQRETEHQRRELARAHAEIDELLRAERAARADAETERARLQQVLDRLPEAVIIVDADGRFAIANAAATHIMGVDLIGRPMPLGDDPAFGAHGLDGSPIPATELPLQRSALRGEMIRGEQLVVRHAQAGRDVPLLVNSAPLHAANGEPAGAVAVFQDITAIKDLERQKDEFLATVSHDLRNPLAGIRGWTQILRRRAARLPEGDRQRWLQDLATVETAATRMGAMIDELLDLTHLQMGRPLELRRERTDLVALVHRVVADHQQLAARHTILVNSEVATLYGVWDETRLERVVGNLVSNAVKYSPDGGTVTVNIARDEPGDATAAVLSVHDQGIGVPAEDLPRIFERFYRASNAATRIAGTGIGLAGAKQLVEQHGGSIDVHSTAGVGSTFVVRLPLSGSSPSGGK